MCLTKCRMNVWVSTECASMWMNEAHLTYHIYILQPIATHSSPPLWAYGTDDERVLRDANRQLTMKINRMNNIQSRIEFIRWSDEIKSKVRVQNNVFSSGTCESKITFSALEINMCETSFVMTEQINNRPKSIVPLDDSKAMGTFINSSFTPHLRNSILCLCWYYMDTAIVDLF